MIKVSAYELIRRRAIFVGVSLLLWLWPLIGNAQNPPSTQGNPQLSSRPLRAAQSALEHGNPQEAVRILSSYLQTHPADSNARTALGQAYAIAGQDGRAEQEFRTVLQAMPDNYVALAALGELFDRGGQPEKAEPMLARAAKTSHGVPQIVMELAVVLVRLHKYKEAQSALATLSPPSDREQQIEFHRLKASVALALGNASAAASEMEKALLLKPDNVRLILATAVAQLQSSNWQRATNLTKPLFARTHDLQAGLILLEAQLGMHADVQPTLELLRSASLPTAEEVEFRQRLAELLVSHGDFSEAIQDLNRAVELEPSRADLLFNLALAQFSAGHLDDALNNAEKCSELGDSAELEDLRGDIQEARGDILAAVKSFQAAVALAPEVEKYRLSLAVELIRHKSFDAAKVTLRQAAESHPNSWRIQFGLGMLEYFAGSEEEASRILIQAAARSPEPQIVLKYVGDIQMDRAAGPEPAALAELCSYADLHPKDANSQFYCGALLFRRDYTAGDKANSSEILRRLSAAAGRLPNDAPPHCQLGKAYRWADQWHEALRESETCVRLDPDSSEAHYHLAQIYHHLGQQEQSRQQMKLFEAASKRVADENARRDETIKTFTYTIQKETPDHK